MTSAQLDDVWGSKSTDPDTLSQMIDDRLYIDGLPSLGLSMTDEDIQNFIDDRFSNPEAPLFTPTPSPTLIPERAAWATGTAFNRNPRFVKELEAKVKKDQLVLLLCRSGNRSAYAAEAAHKAGFEQIYNILEGFEGDLNDAKQRGQFNGWRHHHLPWVQD